MRAPSLKNSYTHTKCSHTHTRKFIWKSAATSYVWFRCPVADGRVRNSGRPLPKQVTAHKWDVWEGFVDHLRRLYRSGHRRVVDNGIWVIKISEPLASQCCLPAAYCCQYLFTCCVTFKMAVPNQQNVPRSATLFVVPLISAFLLAVFVFGSVVPVRVPF